MPTAHNGDVALSYDRAGPSDAPTVIFVEGLGYGKWMWQFQRDPLADSYDTIVFDNRGTGDSDCPEGPYTIAEMAAGAAEFGHDYLAITDHATGPGMVGGVGLSDAELRDQIAAIEDLDASIQVLAGVETNVDADGDLSTGDDVLADLDVVVASPHSGLGQDRETATERLVRAVEHPEVDILGHPTGRLINDRPGIAPDIERVAAAAAEAGTALEVNADPRRLDLDGDAVRIAIEAGATIAIDTDAHGTAALDNDRYGVHTARRGWATAADVLNTRPFDDLSAFLD